MRFRFSRTTWLVVCLLLTGSCEKDPPRPTVSLFDAAKHGNIEQLRSHFHWGCDVNARNSNGESPLDLAIQSGQYETVSLLIEKRAAINSPDPLGKTPVHLAALHGRKQILALLLENGANTNAKDVDGNTPLHLAGNEKEARDTVKLLLEKGANVNEKNREGNTPLHVARWKKPSSWAKEFAELLIGNGADLNLADNGGDTPLCQAISGKNTNIEYIKALVENGAALDKKCGASDMPPIHQAIAAEQVELVEYLLVSGADANSPGQWGIKPLAIASDPRIVKSSDIRKKLSELIVKHGGKKF